MLENLYINAGQMKAGTTFLYHILQQHPDIVFSPEKEIHYFSHHFGSRKILSDQFRLAVAKRHLNSAASSNRGSNHIRLVCRWADNYLKPVDSPNWYANLFAKPKSHQFVSDFSNLTCAIPKEDLKKIKGLSKNIKVTYCLRSAASRAISHMKFHLKFASKDPDLTQFSEEELIEFIRSDNILPQSESHTHISNLAEVFGSNLGIIRCENMWLNPNQAYQNVANFLGLSSELPNDFSNSQAVNVGPSVDNINNVKQIVIRELAKQENKNQGVLDRFSDRVIV